MAIAGLLVGVAVFLLVGYNWEAMPSSLKLVVIFGVIVGTYAAGFYLRYTRKALTASELVFFLGCLFYGTGIWLVAQIFHLNAHYPDGVWWWALGVLPFALCLDALLLHALLVALLGIWAGIEVLGFSDLGIWFFGRRGFIPNGAYTLPLLALPGLVWAYRKNSPATVGLYAPLLAWWVILMPFAWRSTANPTHFIGAIGALFLLISESHRSGSPFAVPYRLWGALLTTGVLVPLSYYDFNRTMLRHGSGPGGFWQTLTIVALAFATVAVASAVQHRLRGGPTRFSARVADIIRRQWLPLTLVLLMAFLAVWESFCRSLGAAEKTALVPTILANVAMIGCGLLLITVGLREDSGRQFAGGVLYFLLWAVLRYMDLFGDYGGMLGAALMFFLCGAALFGMALYWRKRKGDLVA